MKVVTGETMQHMDLQTINDYGVPGLDLMERAGKGCAAAIIADFGDRGSRKAVIVAGKGNNGGDGYVIARILLAAGWDVKTFVIARREEIGGDALVNLERLAASAVTFCPESGGLAAYRSELAAATVIIDALFGTGLKTHLRGVYLEVVDLINSAGRPVVAVDIPSGIDANTGKELGAAVEAELTVTFALAKLGHVLYPGAMQCGRIKVIDIGVPANVMAAVPGFEFLDRESVRLLLQRRPRIAHKGDFGHVLIVAGSTGKSGAAVMAANSAVRGGAGLVTLAGPSGIHTILEMKTTEAMTLPLPDLGNGFLGEAAVPAIVGASSGKDAVAIGPGIGSNRETVQLIHTLIAELDLPLVIDADGLNALAQAPDTLLRKKSAKIVLTPHPGEMARLTGGTVAAVESDRIAAARNFAEAYGVNVILKGARTVIAAPDGTVAINGSGNPGMASGGMGDVLTGLLVALIGQGYPPFTACRLGVFLHGHAADLVAADKGEIGISAGDVQERLPYAFRDLLESDATGTL